MAEVYTEELRSGNIEPPSFEDFIFAENKNFQTSSVRCVRELQILYSIADLYRTAISRAKMQTDPQTIDATLFNLLSLVFYQLLIATSSMMRCHPSEAHAATRSSIDAAFIAVLLAHNPSLDVAYVNRKSPMDKPVRHLKNLVRNGALPSPEMMEALLEQYDWFSSNAVHADIKNFRDRVRVKTMKGQATLHFQYFQMPEDENDWKFQYYIVANAFLAILAVLADYLVEKKAIVGVDWRNDVFRTGKEVAHRMEGLRLANNNPCD